MSLYFKFYSNIFFSKGINRILINDIQREEIELISSDIYDVIEDLKSKKSITEILIKYGIKNESIIKEYISYFEQKEYGFYCTKKEYDLFPDLNNNFIKPSQITNSFIEIKSFNQDKFIDFVNQLESFNCSALSIMFYSSVSQNTLLQVIDIFTGKRIKSVEIYIRFSNDIGLSLFEKIKNRVDNHLTKLLIYNSPYNKHIEYKEFNTIINFSKVNIKNFKKCGNVDIKHFQTNQDKYFESLNHNSCLHKKISIDQDGNIKNCPAMSQSFGNIRDTTLEQALNHPDFKKYWNIKKDDIEVCKDCEFRHVCTDCRAFVEDPKNIYSKPLKCGYNPYTNEWEEWSTNPLKQKAIEYYGLQDLVRKDV